jgi:hypothetical protein
MPKKDICIFCNKKYGTKLIYNHYKSCILDIATKYNGILLHISCNKYFLYVLFNHNTTLKEVDKFLRKIWCECCGHLSNFFYKKPTPFENNIIRMIYNKITQIPKNKKIIDIKNIFEINNNEITYIYDFGDQTELTIELLGIFNGNTKVYKNNILLRNKFNLYKCEYCNDYATHLYECELICNFCINNINIKMKKNKDDNVENNWEDIGTFYPIVNSPRFGSCCYGI